MINVFQPTLGEAELEAVREVFDSGWLGKGARTKAFEEAFATHLGVGPQHLVSLNSCTEALFLAMELLDVGPGVDVVLPSISFVGAANAIASRGGRPVFCDVDPRTLNPRVEHVAAALTPATGAVVVLHYGGAPGDIAGIAALCRERGVTLVEDAACAVASSVNGKACGTFGDIGVWSFDAMKILVTVDGGMLWARDPGVAARAARLVNHGLTAASGFARAGAADRWWEFEVSEFGRRSITNDVAAAIGCVQLERLGGFVDRRRAVAERYDRALTGTELLKPPELPSGHESSLYFYWIQLNEALRDLTARTLLERGIYTTFRYSPLHLVPAYGSSAVLPGAEKAARETLCLPIHQALDDDAVDTVVSEVRAVTAARTGREPR